MIEFTKEELNQIAQLVDIALRANGVHGLTFMPILQKAEAVAKELEERNDGVD